MTRAATCFADARFGIDADESHLCPSPNREFFHRSLELGPFNIPMDVDPPEVPAVTIPALIDIQDLRDTRFIHTLAFLPRMIVGVVALLSGTQMGYLFQAASGDGEGFCIGAGATRIGLSAGVVTITVQP